MLLKIEASPPHEGTLQAYKKHSFTNVHQIVRSSYTLLRLFKKWPLLHEYMYSSYIHFHFLEIHTDFFFIKLSYMCNDKVNNIE